MIPTLESLIDELLSIEQPKEDKPSFFHRVHNILKRKDIEKQLQDEKDFDEQRTLRLGKSAEDFLESPYYKELIEPPLRQTIKNSLQKLIKEGEGLTESQLKCEIVAIRKSLSLLASLKLKVVQAKLLREKV